MLVEHESAELGMHMKKLLFFGAACHRLDLVDVPGAYFAAYFISPSLPFQGDQAVDAHTARARA